jgi:hypothetical protein
MPLGPKTIGSEPFVFSVDFSESAEVSGEPKI